MSRPNSKFNFVDSDSAVRLDSRVIVVVTEFTVRRLRKKVEHNESTQLRGD